MALFRRRRQAGPHSSRAEVERFWLWWDDAHGEIASALDDDDPHRLRSLLEIPVREVHPDLSWHAGPGVRARHMLTLSGAHHPALRVITERWRRAGPQDTNVWEFHPAMPATLGAFGEMLAVDGAELDPKRASALVLTDDRRFRLDVSVHHPAFSLLDELTRSEVANVLVGWAIGEDDTDRWIGKISASEIPPLDGVPVPLLGSVTEQVAQRWGGGERWVALEGSFGSSRLVAAVRHPLHRVDYPLLDEHIAVRLPYHEKLPDGQPAEHALGDLLAVQTAISAGLGDDAVLVAFQTASGERLLHFYADSAASPLAAIRQLLGGYIGGDATAQAELDPGWEGVEHLRAACEPR